MAPSRSRSRARTRPCSTRAVVSVRARWPAASMAISRSIASPSRISARPCESREMSAAAIHSWPCRSEPRASSAAVPPVKRYSSEFALRRRPMKSGQARAVTSAGMSEGSRLAGASVSSSMRRTCLAKPRASVSFSTARATAPACSGIMSVAVSSARPIRGCTGRVAKVRPSSVMSPASSTAPRPARMRFAASAWWGGGLSRSFSPCIPGVPHAAASRSAWVRSATSISGAGQAGKDANSDWETQRTTMPGPSRPARPARWFAEDCAHELVTRPEKPRAMSSRGPRARQASTTARTPGTVTDDSAIAVDTITRLPSACRRNTRSCSSELCWPCSVSTATSEESAI